jgi:hypothetical protein
MVTGPDAYPIAYYTGCAGVLTGGRYNGAISVSRFLARARSESTAILTRGGKAPAFAHGWHRHRLIPGHHGWIAYLPR